MKSRNSKIIVLLLLIGLFLTGCGKKEESDTKKPSNDNQNQTDAKNLKIVDANSKSRPYAVMINNISVARPLQSGLQDAYLIYEIIVEIIPIINENPILECDFLTVSTFV